MSESKMNRDILRVRMPESLLRQLKDRAAIRGMPVVSLVRIAIRKFLDQDTGGMDQPKDTTE